MENSVLKIFNKENKCLGTGFVIDDDDEGIFVATCGHVVNKCKNNILVDGFEAIVIQNDYEKDLDLAVLYVKSLFLSPLPLSRNSEATKGKVIGYSNFSGAQKREGIDNIRIKNDILIQKPQQKIEAIKLYPSETISNGYSGSPVICEHTKEVIGIVNIQVGEDTNYAIKSKHLLDIYTVRSKKKKESNTEIKEITTELKPEDYESLKKQFEKNFESALKSFSTQSKMWIEPSLHTKEEESNLLSDQDTKVELSDLITSPSSVVIKAQQQFGLTSLAHYLIKEAWNHQKSSFWLYLDANKLKPHSNEINKYIEEEVKVLGLVKADICCIVLDEFSSNIDDANKILNKLSELFLDIPLVVMLTHIENPLLNEAIEPPLSRSFRVLHLWALHRQGVRKVVCTYNDGQYIANENKVLDKVISDLEVLNIPRTPFNCLTILKISEYEFDDSPVNRTEMIKRVLFLLFNVDDIPKYKTRPDLKDTEYVLGYFSETILKENKYYFTRKSFLEKINMFCNENEIELDVDIIFDVLYKNNIIVMRGQQFCFKFNYWVLYFAAHRMHHDTTFAEYVLKDMWYVPYPELIEFYTGIDRRRDDALIVLTDDIRNTCDLVEKKCALPPEFNIYTIAKWKPSDETIRNMQKEVKEGVQSSQLPDTIKDQYADADYNRARPLTQNFHTILEEYSLLRLMKSIKAGSKALRNSDYSDPKIRHTLLNEILRSWEQITKVLIVLSPILSEQGHATLEGASFILNGDFGKSREEKFNQIIQILPTNVVGWYKNDLFSNKMGKLLFKHIDDESNEFVKHTLNLLIINKRPKGWETYIEDYIISEHKNSFYLFDIYKTLRAEYQYSFASDNTLGILGNLIKITATKHELGIKSPSKKVIKRIEKQNGFDEILPKRNIE